MISAPRSQRVSTRACSPRLPLRAIAANRITRVKKLAPGATWAPANRNLLCARRQSTVLMSCLTVRSSAPNSHAIFAALLEQPRSLSSVA